MTKIKCPNCNGTGKEWCEAHGKYESCDTCNGTGHVKSPYIKVRYDGWFT